MYRLDFKYCILYPQDLPRILGLQWFVHECAQQTFFFNRKNGDNLFELRPTPVSDKSQIWLLQHIPHMCFFVGKMLNWLLFPALNAAWFWYGLRVLPMESNGFIPCDFQQLTVLMKHITYGFPTFPHSDVLFASSMSTIYTRGCLFWLCLQDPLMNRNCLITLVAVCP
jgi:hypothetical protein